MTMADTKTITEEAAGQVGGGACTPAEILDLTNKLTDAYESLVDFTSHVIGRVAGE
jgi:hypothetical protein